VKTGTTTDGQRNAAPPQSAETSEASTRQRVFAEVLGHGPVTASQVARRLGLTDPAIRRHLDALAAEGLVSSRDALQRGPRGRGRPPQAYVVTEAGRARFRKDYDRLALSAFAELIRAVGPMAIDRVAAAHFSPIGEEYRRRLAADGAPDPQAAVAALAGVLEEAGYAASLSALPGAEQLCQHHCPVADIARAYPQICEIETELIASLLGSHVQRLATIAHGDGVCTTNIPVQKIEVRR